MSTSQRLLGLILLFVSLGCAKDKLEALEPATAMNLQAERNRESGAWVSPEAQRKAEDIISGKIQVKGRARLAILYYLDRPAHREAILRWLEEHGAAPLFESKRFGFIDAKLDWKDVGALINTSGNLGLDQSSLMKLEFDELEAATEQEKGKNKNPRSQQPAPEENSSFAGPVHSAGYGARVEQFRDLLAGEFKEPRENFEGQGTKVSVFDSGMDLSRTDVFGSRIQDFIIGEARNWIPAELTLQKFQEEEKTTKFPAGLEDEKEEPSLRFCFLDEAVVDTDLNGNGKKDDKLAVAVFKREGVLQVRFRVDRALPFGDALLDIGEAHNRKTPQSVNLLSGKHYVREAANPSPSAVGVKIRETDGVLSVAFVGTMNRAEHGIANLHMVGGDYITGPRGVRYRGVAPQTDFLVASTWFYDGKEYADKWIPLARNIIQSAEARVDVIDLDIATPGVRDGNDLLSKLLCRITVLTDSVPVIAAHNYGPLPGSVQSLAQSPCALGIGASVTVDAMKYGYSQGSVDPMLEQGDSVLTTFYSGRGFGLNGFYKPDIISPAYAYTAYGSEFTRFGGTSGATPTTAGLIALLKQGARKLGLELNFHQVRFLLQGSSQGTVKLRDGYGYSDLEAAWKLLKKNYDAASKKFLIEPFFLSGQQPIHFDGKPSRRVFSLSLVRNQVQGAATDPVPMKFSVRYDEGSQKLKKSWLKLQDSSTGQFVDALELDAPMVGETQRLKLVVDLDEETWNTLPSGDYIAIIQGVRKNLAEGRNVDFLLPVSFTKGERPDESMFDVRPLYIHQSQEFSIATAPGEVLHLSAETRCEGKTITTAVKGNAADSLMLVVDTQAAYPGAAVMMSSYSSLYTSLVPLRLLANKPLIRFFIGRYSQFNCDGPVSARVFLRRTGISLKTGDTEMRADDKMTRIKSKAELTLTGAPLLSAELYRSVEWRLKDTGARMVLSRALDAGTSFVIPKGVKRIRVIPDKPAVFQGLLAVQDKKGKIIEQISTQDALSWTGGMGSLHQALWAGYVGLEISEPDAGNMLFYLPAQEKDKATSGARMEMIMSMPEGAVVELENANQAISSWRAGETRQVSMKAVFPAVLSEEMSAFPSSEWSYGVELGLKLEEKMLNSRPGAAELVPMDLWQSTWRAPLSI